MNDVSALDAYPTNIAPTARGLGPFPHAPFIAAVHSRLAPGNAELIVEADDQGAVALSLTDGILRFAAEEFVTDYHAPLGPGGGEALERAIKASGALSFEFDSLPAEEHDVVTATLDRLSIAHQEEVHAATGVLALPESFDEWLAGIRKKERHEVRRKRRKLIAEFGPFTVEEAGVEGIGAFCDLHRTAAGDKGGFMTDTVQAFFTDLLANVDATIHNLVCDGRTLSSAFGFVRDDGYYFYNSAFDADAHHVSPGAVLLSALIEQQIERGAQVFDFLKGAETYKYRHGAVPRDLYRISGSLA